MYGFIQSHANQRKHTHFCVNVAFFAGFTALRCAIPDSAWHRLQTHSERSTCPKLRCPRCWRGSKNSSNSSVISIPQLRRCATCPSEQRRNPKSSSQRKGQTLMFTYMTTSKKNISRAYVCVSAISFTLQYPLLDQKVWRDLRKSAPSDVLQVRSQEENLARNANIFLMSCKKKEKKKR